jgi:hypothetical protein
MLTVAVIAVVGGAGAAMGAWGFSKVTGGMGYLHKHFNKLEDRVSVLEAQK